MYDLVDRVISGALKPDHATSVLAAIVVKMVVAHILKIGDTGGLLFERFVCLKLMNYLHKTKQGMK